MPHHLVTYLKLIYPAMHDLETFKRIDGKIDAWKLLHEDEFINITLKMIDEIEKRKAYLGELGSQKDEMPLFREFADKPDGFVDTYYKIAVDFVHNQFFVLTLNKLSRFMIENKRSLTEESLLAFLTKNESEVGNLSIKDYLARLDKDAANLNSCMQHHRDFIDSLSRRVQGEDVNTSRLMAAWLVYKLIEDDDWFNLIAKVNASTSISDTAYFFIDYAFRAGSNDCVNRFLKTVFPFLEAAAYSFKHDGRVSLEDKKALVTVMLKYYIVSLFDESLMKFYSTVKTLIPFIKVNQVLTVKDLGGKSRSVETSWGEYHASVTIETEILQNVRNGHIMTLSRLLAWANHNDKDIFANLMKLGIFNKILLKMPVLKKYNVDIKTLASGFYNLTNENTKQIWNDIPIQVSAIFHEKAFEVTQEFVKSHPDLEILRSVRNLMLFYKLHKKQVDLILESPHTYDSSPLKNGKNSLQDSFNHMHNIFFMLREYPTCLANFYIHHQDDIPHINNLLICMFELSDKELKVKALYRDIIKEIEAISKTAELDERLLPAKFFVKLQKGNEEMRECTLLLSPFIKRKYGEMLAAQKQAALLNKAAKNQATISSGAKRKVLSKEEVEKNKQFTASLLLKPAQQEPVKALQPKKKSTPKPKQVEIKKEKLKLNEKEKDNFLVCMRALFAGDPNIQLVWTVAENNKVDYLKLNFADVGHVFNAKMKIDQNPQSFTLTLDARKEFLTRRLPILFKNHLEYDALLVIEDDGLRLIPKKAQCSYPVSLLEAAFLLLQKSSEQQKNEVQRSHGNKRHHVSASIGVPTVTLVKAASTQEVKTSVAKLKIEEVHAESLVKTLFSQIVAERYPDQAFNIIRVKEKRNRLIININLKGAPCLSDKDQVQVDTYVVMSSIVAALQEQLGKDDITFKPEGLIPDEYEKQESCQIVMKGEKNKWKGVAEGEMQHLKTAFAQHLKDQEGIAALFKKINKCKQLLEGRSEQWVVITQPEQKEEDGLYKQYQQRQISKQQYACLCVLFEEVRNLNKSLLDNKDDKLLSLATESKKFVCYHRIFHHLAYLFKENKDQTNSIFMMALRNAFRHGYLEVSDEASQFIDKLVLAFMEDMTYRGDTNSFYAKEEVGYVSFKVTQQLHDGLMTHATAFVLQASRRAIGNATRSDRVQLVPDIEAAISYIESSSAVDKNQACSLVVAMMSRIGEVIKNTPYAKIYGQLGMHDESLMALPDQTDAEIYESLTHRVGSKKRGNK